MIRVTKKIWLFGVPAILLIGLAVMTVTFFRQRKTIAEQQRVIDAQTESAYRALSNDLNDLNVALSKLEAAGTPARLSKSFADIRRLSAGAVRALSLLPVAHADDEGLMQFLTRTGDFADTLMDRVLNGQMLTEEQLGSLSELKTCCSGLSEKYDGGCMDGTFPTAPEDGFYSGETDEENIANYPSLLYDGPFSESSEQAEPLGLPEKTVDENEAMRIASELFPDLMIGIFTSDPQLKDIADRGIRAMNPVVPLVGWQMVSTNFFQSLGMVKKSIFLSLTRQLLFLVPLVYLLPSFMDIRGVFFAFPCSDALAFIATLILIVNLFRKFSKLRDGDQPDLLGSNIR